MTLFESDGVYAGIPYRVLPDASIEAMMPGGLVKFKNMYHLLASANGLLAKSNVTRPIISLDMPGERIANVPAATQPLDYYSILVEAIKKTEQNSAQLRQLVYERARFNFKRDVLFGHSSLGLSDLVRHINDFELAVARIEASTTGDRPSPEYRENESEHTASHPEAAPKDDRPRTADTDAEDVEPSDTAPFSPGTALQILPPQPIPPLYAGFAPVQRMEDSPYDRRPEEFAFYKRFANQLVGILVAGIVLIGIIIFFGTFWLSSKAPPQIVVANTLPKTEVTAAKQNSSNLQDATQKDDSPKVPYPLPTSFGIYVLSDNKLTELQALAMNVPDPRIALSSEIKTPSTITISDNKPAFILFRRDLVNNVPQKITLRVVARLARETKIVDGKATSTNIEGAWRIRNISRELRVSPIPGQREMVIARLEDNVSLAAGRYELALNRTGYDFTVAGPVKAPAQCLEQFESTTGPIYSECRSQ
jgi:hypothetical protein